MRMHPFQNPRQSPSTMIYLTDHEKRKVFDGVKGMLTEWAGGVNLVPTSCYGVRLVSRACPALPVCLPDFLWPFAGILRGSWK